MVPVASCLIQISSPEGVKRLIWTHRKPFGRGPITLTKTSGRPARPPEMQRVSGMHRSTRSPGTGLPCAAEIRALTRNPGRSGLVSHVPGGGGGSPSGGSGPNSVAGSEKVPGAS